MPNNPYAFIQRIRPIELGFLVKKLLRVKRFVYPLKGFSLWIDPASQLGVQLLSQQQYEENLTTYVRSTLQEGDTFIDLGANEGWFSVIAAKKVGPRGTIIAIEPQERLWSVLIKNFFINNITNYFLVPCAIGTKEEDKLMVLNPDINNGASSFVGNFRNFFWPKQVTSLITLDSVFAQYKIEGVDLIKIDIEGYEYFALLSGTKTFAEKKIKRAVVEIHPQQLAQLSIPVQNIFAFFEEKGYVHSNSNGIDVFTASDTIS